MDNNLNFSQIRIENTNLCTYKCIMCPREKMKRKMGIMSFDDFKNILDFFDDFQEELHLHGYGEPLLDPNLMKKISFARKKYPKAKIIIFTTLGMDLKKSWFDEFVNSGINLINISLYGYNINTYRAIHGRDNFNLVLKNLKFLDDANKKMAYPVIISLQIPSDTLMNQIKEKNSFTEMLSFFNYLKTLKITLINQIQLVNYGNGRKFNKSMPNNPCPSQRKKILQITWDLKVIPCCFDYNADIVLGDLKKQSLQEIFSDKKYLDLIEAHKNRNLINYPVCFECDKSHLKKMDL